MSQGAQGCCWPQCFAHAGVLPAALPHTVQCSHRTSLKPAMPSLCPCPAELTSLHPTQLQPDHICPASSFSSPLPLTRLCQQQAGSRGPILPLPGSRMLLGTSIAQSCLGPVGGGSSFLEFPSDWVGVFFVCLLEICVDSCLSLTSPCVTWGSPLGTAP